LRLRRIRKKKGLVNNPMSKYKTAGLRIGEALGLEIDKHISQDFLTISIEQKARHCKIEKRLKTASASRQVDLHPEIAAMLKKFAGERKAGFLFRTRNGKPLGSSCILRRHLHPALKQLGFINPFTHTHKAEQPASGPINAHVGRNDSLLT
jgi:integrase